jgi:hypothetical protein
LPHGHVDAVLGTARKIGLDRLLGPKPAPAQAGGNRCRNLILALVVSRILDPGSKLAAARALSPDTATPSLGEQLALGVVDEDELYSALDWLILISDAPLTRRNEKWIRVIFRQTFWLQNGHRRKVLAGRPDAGESAAACGLARCRHARWTLC